jgi:hypothetical protein
MKTRMIHLKQILHGSKDDFLLLLFVGLPTLVLLILLRAYFIFENLF